MRVEKEKNIFGSQVSNKPERKKRLILAGFYGPVLMLFALLIAAKGGKSDMSFFGLFHTGEQGGMWKRALVVYLYLLSFMLLIVYTYLGLEKLVRHKKHLLFFRILLIALPLISAGLIYLVEPQWKSTHWLFVTGLAILSVGGLLMIDIAQRRK